MNSANKYNSKKAVMLR